MWKYRQICVLKEAFAFLQVFLLPVGEGVKLNPTHLKKVLKTFEKEAGHHTLWNVYVAHVSTASGQVSYPEVLVRQVIFEAQGIHPLWQRFPGQLFNRVLLPAELRQRLLH